MCELVYGIILLFLSINVCMIKRCARACIAKGLRDGCFHRPIGGSLVGCPVG